MVRRCVGCGRFCGMRGDRPGWLRGTGGWSDEGVGC